MVYFFTRKREGCFIGTAVFFMFAFSGNRAVFRVQFQLCVAIVYIICSCLFVLSFICVRHCSEYKLSLYKYNTNSNSNSIINFDALQQFIR